MTRTGNGPTVISRASGNSGGFILSCDNCIGVVIDGSQQVEWRSEREDLRHQGDDDGRRSTVRICQDRRDCPASSRFATSRSTGHGPRCAKSGSGIRVNDDSVKRNAHPGLWREGILIEDNYVHDIALEGMYVGPNYQDGDLPLRNIEIRNNLVEDTGWEGINAKSMWAGDNSIHHNTSAGRARTARISGEASSVLGDQEQLRYGEDLQQLDRDNRPARNSGVDAEGPRTSEGKGPFEAHIWNNVIVDAGGLWRSFMNKSYGINVGAQAGREKPVPRIYNNTIVNSRAERDLSWPAMSARDSCATTSPRGPEAIRSSLLPVSWTSSTTASVRYRRWSSWTRIA